jgi:hypothetical protein
MAGNGDASTFGNHLAILTHHPPTSHSPPAHLPLTSRPPPAHLPLTTRPTSRPPPANTAGASPITCPTYTPDQPRRAGRGVGVLAVLAVLTRLLLRHV